MKLSVFGVLCLLCITGCSGAEIKRQPAFARATASSSALQFREEAVSFPGSRLYVPNDGKPHPGILVLHGSDGGGMALTSALIAQNLASNGYTALALCYFDCNRTFTGPHETLAQVEIQKIFDALSWLKNSEFVKNQKTAVYGYSRGAELSLLIGEKSGLSDHPAITPDALIAHAPLSEVWGAWNWGWKDPVCWTCKTPSNCPDDLPLKDWIWNPACGTNPVRPDGTRVSATVPGWKWHDVPDQIGRRIEAEKYSGPIFISVGTKDGSGAGTSVSETQKIEKALLAAGKTPEVHYFEGEGHMFGPAGSNQENEMILKFLDKALH